MLQEESTASFPSGHVMHAVAFFGTLAVLMAIRARSVAALRTAQGLLVLTMLATGISPYT